VRKVFISYARQNKPHVEALVEHLQVLGCETWHDSSLHGGQDWWEEILRRIADCDTFIAIISRDALSSTACRREFDWAESLNKPVLPVAVEPPPKALPRRFSTRQIVDYSDPAARDRAALTLAGGLATLPSAPPLPDPLPDAPAAPLSYLTDLIDLVSEGKTLDHEQQRHVLNQLETAVRSVDPEEQRGARDILAMLAGRDDLYADVDRHLVRLRALDDYSPAVAQADGGGSEGSMPASRPESSEVVPGPEPTASALTVTEDRQPPPPLSPSAPFATGRRAEPLASPVTDLGSNRQRSEPVPTPRPQRRAALIAGIGATVAVLAAGIIGVTGYHLLKHPHPSQTPSTSQSPPPPPTALDGLLLGVDQINAAMGTTEMSSAGTMIAMPDNSFLVSDQACLPLSAAAQAKVYSGSGYSAVKAQVVAKAQQNAVDQAVVLFPSPHDAGSFFTASAQRWQACSARQFTLAANGNSQVQTVGPVSNTNGTLSATVTPANSPGTCERALTVANSVAIDVTACLGPPGAAVSIAHQIAAKVLVRN